MSRYLEQYRKIYNENYREFALTLNRYSNTDVFIESYKGNFQEICKQISSLEDRGYYRFKGLRQDTDRWTENYRCFNTSGRTKGGLNFELDELMNRYLNMAINDWFSGTRDAGFLNESYDFYHFIFAYAFLKAFIDRLLSNDTSEFQKIIAKLKGKYRKLEVITDLEKYDNCTGVYILILRQYNTCYVGKSNNIRKRIKEHWSTSRGFDIKGIDTFKVGDTSEILFYKCSSYKMDEIEEKFIVNIPMQYTLNWVKGGEMSIQEESFFTFKQVGFEDVLISDLTKTEELLPAVATKFCGENYL